MYEYINNSLWHFVVQNGFLKQHTTLCVINHDTLGVHVTGRCRASHRHQVAQGGINYKRVKHRIAHQYWYDKYPKRQWLILPPRHAEQRKSLLFKAVTTLNPLSPPLTKVPSRAKQL